MPKQIPGQHSASGDKLLIAYLFPGQGAQVIGMGRALYEADAVARSTIDSIENICKLPLKRLMWEGPASELTATWHAQLALFACSVAAYRAFRNAGAPEPRFVAGHSVGEYAALVAAEAIELEPAVDLVSLRGKSMAAAPPGTMAALIGLAVDKLEAICQTVDGTVTVANYNSPEQFVISGEYAAVEAACEMALVAGAKRAIRLNVGGAFHSPLMLPALGPLSAALATAPWKATRIPVVHNVDALPNRETQQFIDRLSRQLAGNVRWTDGILAMRDGGSRIFVELGCGRTLTGLLRRIDKTLSGLVVEDPRSLGEAIAKLSASGVIPDKESPQVTRRQYQLDNC
ncbi:MAG: ACP S-malonyltransferase [Cyanobacteria bacterium NC_groundwater_1444_Ag_S-0.65um_54_12]|nr:ACP S-malonyltransferase [Cyanobacteria bacterium NC_groundwater_1444_Ag_S-0.65um_54_12]